MWLKKYGLNDVRCRKRSRIQKGRNIILLEIFLVFSLATAVRNMDVDKLDFHILISFGLCVKTEVDNMSPKRCLWPMT